MMFHFSSLDVYVNTVLNEMPDYQQDARNCFNEELLSTDVNGDGKGDLICGTKQVPFKDFHLNVV